MKNIVFALVLFVMTSMTVQAGAKNDGPGGAIDAIVSGKVIDLVEFAHLSDDEGLWVATIEIDQVVQGHKLISGTTVQVYFLWNGKTTDDSPKHVELTKGEKAEFHLDARPLMEDREVFFLDAQTDVKS